MQDLKDYKQTITITPHSIKAQHVILTVRLQQHKPTRIYTYQVSKTKKQLSHLFNTLAEDIFDFISPRKATIIASIGGRQEYQEEQLRQALQECTERLDILTHRTFVGFFMLHLHYTDFVASLREEEMLMTQAVGSEAAKMTQNGKEWFEKMITLIKHHQNHLLEISKMSVIDLAYLSRHDQEVIFVLQTPKKAAKISSFLKSFFRQQEVEGGYLAIHRKVGGKYLQKSRLKIQAEPIRLTYLQKPNMLLVLTVVGIQVYLPKMQHKFQQVQLFSYIQLVGVVDYAHNAIDGQLYLLECELNQGLHVYSFNKDVLMKTQFKMKNPKSLCFQEQHHRLYVNNQSHLHVFLVTAFMELKLLHTVDISDSFNRILLAHGYLYCLNATSGRLKVLELKPPQKQQLLNVAANIDLPSSSNSLATSPEHKRILISRHNHSIVLVDTIQGPIYVQPQIERTPIASLHFNYESNTILTVTEDGILNTHKITL